MMSVQSGKSRALPLFSAYALATGAAAAWCVSGAELGAAVDPQMIRNYLSAVAVITAAFLALTAVPALRAGLVAAALLLALIASGPAVLNQPSVAENVTVYYLKAAGVPVEASRR